MPFYARIPGGHLVANARFRWAFYAGAALVLMILVVFPPRYVARAKVVPQDTGAIMNRLGWQTQNPETLLGGGPRSSDLYLVIGRSDSVAEQVIRNLQLAGSKPTPDSIDDARIALAGKVDVHLLLGGVLEIQAKSRDPAEAQRLTATYVRAFGQQLAAFAHQRAATQRNEGALPTEPVQFERLAVDSAAYVQGIDPAHLDPEPHWNRSALALLAGIALWAVFFEWYAPSTGLFRFEPVPVRAAETHGE